MRKILSSPLIKETGLCMSYYYCWADRRTREFDVDLASDKEMPQTKDDKNEKSEFFLPAMSDGPKRKSKRAAAVCCRFLSVVSILRLTHSCDSESCGEILLSMCIFLPLPSAHTYVTRVKRTDHYSPSLLVTSF